MFSIWLVILILVILIFFFLFSIILEVFNISLEWNDVEAILVLESGDNESLGLFVKGSIYVNWIISISSRSRNEFIE